VAETKGSMSSMQLNEIEKTKIEVRPQVLRRDQPEVRP
jgi:hypothetical protein